MFAGRFKDVVTVQTKTVTKNHAGISNAWADATPARRRASVSPVSAHIRAQYAQNANAIPSYQIKFRSPLNLQAENIRFLWKGRTYYPTTQAQNYEGADLIMVTEKENG